jgi:hypothetical protein
MTDTGTDADVIPLRAVPGDVTGPATNAPTYADVTAPGERRPILPPWLASADALRQKVQLSAGFMWHAAQFHAVRSPVTCP